MYYIVCHTIGGDDVGAECIRHWKYLGLPSQRYDEYFGCANPENLRSQDWCPTEVNRDGEYVIGSDKWGFCPDNCPKHNNSISPSMEEEDLDGSRSESINNSHENSETKEIDEDGSENFLAGDNSDGEGHKPMGRSDWSHSDCCDVEFCELSVNRSNGSVRGVLIPRIHGTFV